MRKKRNLFSLWLLCIGLIFFGPAAFADTMPSLYNSFAGYVNFVGAQRTLRTGDNTSNTTASSLVSGATTAAGSALTTVTLSGLSGATIRAAYLYWAGSGDTPDYSVNFEGNAITADRQYTITNAAGVTGINYFSGVADVTATVTAKGDGTYTFSGLTVENGDPWYSSQAVLAGWALLVVYENPATERFRVLNVYEGFQPFYGSNIPLTISNFRTPASNIDGRLGHLTWEGDVTNSTSQNGFSEQLRFNSTTLSDTSNPIGNQFNSVSTIRGAGAVDTASYGVDFDAYDIGPYLTPGATSATSVYSSGADLVLLSMEVISVTNTPVADLSITKVLNGTLNRGQNASYAINVTNNGPSNEAGPIIVRDTLPAGLSFVSASGTGWSCNFASGTVTCTYNSSLANGTTAPTVTLTVGVSASASGTISNSATVTGTNFDNDSGNDMATDSHGVASADLALAMVRNGALTQGQSTTYTLTVNNNGPLNEPGPISLTYTLPSGLTFVSGVGGGWTCNASGCNYSGSLASGGATSVILTVAVGATATGSKTTSATVTGTQYDANLANNTASDTYTILPAAYAYYIMDEAAWTGGVVPDSSGLGHDGTVLGSAAPTGYPPSIPAGSAISGNPGTCGAGFIPSGTSQGVSTPVDVNSNLGNAGSIAFWYSSNTVWNDGNDRMLFDASNNLGGGNADKHFYLVKRTNGSLMFALEDSGDTNSNATSPSYSFAANTWHHIAVTWNLGADRLYIYLDGNPTPVATSTTGVNGTLGNTNTLYIGAQRSTAINNTAGSYTSNSANGYIDEFYAFSGALSSSQVTQLKNNTHSCGALVTHYAISYPLVNPGVTCEAMAVRITGHASDHSVVPPAANTQITLSTSPAAGGWALKSGAGVFTPPNKYTFSGAENSVDFWLTQTTPTTAPHINISVTDGSKTDLEGDITEDVRAQFLDTGFLFADASGNPVSINNQIAGKDANVAPNAQNLYLRAVRKSDNSNACVAALQGTTPIDWAYECNDPTTCSGSNLLSLAAAETKAISRNSNGGVSTYTAVNMTFDSNGYAPFNFKYSDAGKIKLYVQKTLTAGIGTPPSTPATLSTSSNSFIVKPAGFVLSNIQQTAAPNTANPAAADANGLVFVRAGEDFSITATAVDTAGNATPNFGKEISPEGVKLTSTLVAPSGGVNGNFTGAFGTFSSGAASGSTFKWDEVGIINLQPSVLDGDYLGAGNVDTSGTYDKIVGRFIPDHFGLAGSLAVRSDLPRTTSSISAGSSALTVAAATGILAGNRLLVLGAGPGGTALQADVSLISGNTLTLSKTASTSVTGAKVYIVMTRETTGSVAIGSATLTVNDATGISVGDILVVLGAGPGGTALRANVSSISGNTVTLSMAASTSVIGARVLSTQDTFTYMGEPMLTHLEVTAYNAGDQPTKNYEGDFAKLSAGALGTGTNWFATGCSAGVQCFGLGAINGTTTGLTSRLNIDTSVSNPVSSWTQGVGTFSTQVYLARPTSTTADATWGPYDVLSIGGAPKDSDDVTLPGATSLDAHHIDLDADANSVNERRLVFTSKSRLGRLNFSSEYGSELLPLPIHVAAQWWNGATFLTNPLDNATSFATSAVNISNPKKNLALNEISIAAPTSVVFTNGVATFRLAKPTGGDGKYDGSVDMTTTVFPYLPANTGRASFGVYKSGPVIYIREMF
ncbi:DUF6701 domain-containing protein [Herbaspirillum sp. ST 5-3]|uniref:DUF6701 domain-containing protein n=1 Tax=Oxalobacteraceae TaxID=75682 RepID=UPI00145608F3|nr:DUF6701 domain-containing protein [Herbaspirillum sp. ST 5-3]